MCKKVGEERINAAFTRYCCRNSIRKENKQIKGPTAP